MRHRPVLPLLFGAKVVDLADWSVEAEAEIAVLRARVEDLEKALRPFAELKNWEWPSPCTPIFIGHRVDTPDDPWTIARRLLGPGVTS